jgi:hypothetical protein
MDVKKLNLSKYFDKHSINFILYQINIMNKVNLQLSMIE